MNSKSQVKVIPYGCQDITKEDVEAVTLVLKSQYLTQGPVVPLFESAVANNCAVKFAVAFNSATSALHVACLALGLQKGDWLWTSSVSFVASANCGLYCGAAVDFVDIDPETFLISTDCLKIKLEEADKKGNLPKILVVVHMCGQSCDMAAIRALAKKYRFFIIEDASHALGATYQEGSVGNCEFSEITVFSFHPVKNVTSGEGGVAVTNNVQLAEKMMLYRSHGIIREKGSLTEQTAPEWYYEQHALGYNYRLSDIHAALGLSQMQRLHMYTKRRQELAGQYDQELRHLAVQPQKMLHYGKSAFHLYVVRLPGKTQVRKNQIMQHMRSEQIMVNVHYLPIHLHPYYKALGFNEGDFPEAERYYREAITLPLYPSLKDEEIVRVKSTLEVALSL